MMTRLVLVAMFLSACAAQAQREEAPVTSVAASAGAPAATGEARIGVRAVTRPGGPSVAADCEASGAGFRTSFAAPATVAAPTFGRSSGPVRIACQAAGLRGVVTAAPSVARSPGGGVLPVVGIGVSSGGGGGVSVGGIFDGGVFTGGNDTIVRYPSVEVVLE